MYPGSWLPAATHSPDSSLRTLRSDKPRTPRLVHHISIAYHVLRLWMAGPERELLPVGAQEWFVPSATRWAVWDQDGTRMARVKCMRQRPLRNAGKAA